MDDRILPGLVPRPGTMTLKISMDRSFSDKERTGLHISYQWIYVTGTTSYLSQRRVCQETVSLPSSESHNTDGKCETYEMISSRSKIPTRNGEPLGAPFALGSAEKEYCVFAIQTKNKGVRQ